MRHFRQLSRNKFGGGFALLGFQNKGMVLHLQRDGHSQGNRKIAAGFMSCRNISDHRKGSTCKEAVHEMAEGSFGGCIILYFHAGKKEIAGFVILYGD